ncbi:hypothetical protein GOP47_0007945 [Adiantum capillus-veneris]|uniref:Uncharacterized protein n=1 Tax=Adiantum capillus-veneris TaxID=13818 RepID=A0A9D4V1N8_ADICA|nr:hypothetical protein GOP47_0007945 [Adiantum capillus-veneris]
MEISATLHSSSRPYFSDRSYLAFHGRYPGKPITSLLIREPSSSLSASSSASSPALCASPDPTLTPITACTSCAAVASELAHLKGLVKLKKKQLRAAIKERKKALKQKGAIKAKNGSCSLSLSSSSSSSSSESSDEEKAGGARKMKFLKQGLSQFRDERMAKTGMAYNSTGHDETISAFHHEGEKCTYVGCKICSSNDSTMDNISVGASRNLSMKFPSVRPLSGGSIEVCVGGKCKRAGSEELLLSLKTHLDGQRQVDVACCKCMGRCDSAINVKVMREDTIRQHHSGVSVDDAGLILRHHFGHPSLSLSVCPSSLPHSTPVSTLHN